ncbi:MAG: phosphodiester glycosidase family protein [Pedobacter sp.]|nr:phosphodiester glycosidase family protein [Chitinophagaceae bacterium]
MKKQILLLIALLPLLLTAQVHWKNVDSLYAPLPPTVHVFYTNDSIDGKPNIAYYVSAQLKDKNIDFTTQIGNGKRFTPTQYFETEDKPLVVVNCTFFEFVHNSNLNLVMNDGKLLAYNNEAIVGRGKDTFTYRHTLNSAIGINQKRKADVAWLYTDSSFQIPYASQVAVEPIKDSSIKFHYNTSALKKWKMQVAVGGGPVLLQRGNILISNNQEMKFGGKQGLTDKHPRTCMGYTNSGRLIIMVIQGRFLGIAEGVNLTQEAQLLKDIGCNEALNLDGGGSSCLLVNGKPTIKVSDKEGQRPVPAVFMIKKR